MTRSGRVHWPDACSILDTHIPLNWRDSLNKLARIVIAVSVIILTGSFWRMSTLLSEANESLASSRLSVLAIEATERVEIAEQIRSGNLQEALDLLESRIYMDGDTLADRLVESDEKNRKFVSAAIESIENYKRQFPWQP